MTEFYTVKQIDNSRLVRTLAPDRLRECVRLVGVAALLALMALCYAWQHFECIQMRSQLESLKQEHSQAVELNQELKLEVASLRDPGRIDLIARRQLGLTISASSEIVPAEPPMEPVMAQARTSSPAAAQ
ncbi:MAG TPA: cell division protein FtsL [Methylomirabilota bacterium]|nr:cell division protein FtsL [Methylomirabilota bacterium]